MGKVLIVYFSRKGENYYDGKICNIEKGNTEIVAEFIQKATGGDLFKVEPKTAYPENYYDCTEEAKRDLDSRERVPVKAFLNSVDGYDAIFVGYPNWWDTMPMAMFTFLEHYDLSGKTVIPFCTNEGSGMGVSERDLKRICVGATVKNGLPIRGTDAAKSEDKVTAWLKEIL